MLVTYFQQTNHWFALHFGSESDNAVSAPRAEEIQQGTSSEVDIFTKMLPAILYSMKIIWNRTTFLFLFKDKEELDAISSRSCG